MIMNKEIAGLTDLFELKKIINITCQGPGRAGPRGWPGDEELAKGQQAPHQAACQVL